MLLMQLAPASGQEQSNRKIPTLLNQVLGWLPIDSETLVVSTGPFPFPRKSTDDLPFLETAHNLSFAWVTQLDNGRLQEALQGQKVLVAMEGSRRFTRPKELGMMPYEGCAVLQFDVSAHEALQAAVAACFERAVETVRVGDTKAAVFIEKSRLDDWRLLIAQPRPGVLLCATNQKFLEEVLTRMKGTPSDRAFPEQLPEWEHVNTAAAVWGMRHFRRDFVDTDPSSPLRDQAAANFPDLGAVGLVFSIDAKSDPVAKVRYLTKANALIRGSNDGLQIATQAWHHPSEKLTPTIKKVQPGVIEISAFSPTNMESGHMFLFVLLAYLGHAIYV
jgi:hypothetical protein